MSTKASALFRGTELGMTQDARPKCHHYSCGILLCLDTFHYSQGIHSQPQLCINPCLWVFSSASIQRNHCPLSIHGRTVRKPSILKSCDKLQFAKLALALYCPEGHSEHQVWPKPQELGQQQPWES